MLDCIGVMEGFCAVEVLLVLVHLFKYFDWIVSALLLVAKSRVRT